MTTDEPAPTVPRSTSTSSGRPHDHPPPQEPERTVAIRVGVVAMRRCPECGKELKRHPKEPPGAFRDRTFCNRSCAAPTRNAAAAQTKRIKRAASKFPEDFWHNIRVTESGCWVWTGSRHSNEYGYLQREFRRHSTHRLAYEQRFGVIPDGMYIDHLCRNRPCCNPDHLEAVTPLENARRGMSPTMIASLWNECMKGHPMSGANLFVSPSGYRYCRRCLDVREARKRSRK